MKLFRLETLITILLMATITPIVVNRFCPRKMVVQPDANWQAIGSDDHYAGGTSTSNVWQSEDAFGMDYQLDDNCSNPYVLISIRPRKSVEYDLSWVENYQLAIRCSKSNTRFHFHVCNNESFTSPDQTNSSKYNEALIHPQEQLTIINVSRSDFHVPAWWIQQYDVPADDSATRFNRVERLEFASVGRSGIGQLQIQSITATGSRIAATLLYPTLLMMWITSFVSVLLYRFWRLRRELIQRQAVEKELIAIHDKLECQSQELEIIAHSDPLTGIFNRRGIRSAIESAMSEREDEKTFSLIMLDVDHFKHINDEHGHSYGDDVLCDLVTIVNQELRSNDVLARWGGEEFMILCPETSLEKATTLAEQLRTKIAGGNFGYTCSLGISEATPNEDFSSALERADLALYQAKRNGRNQAIAHNGIECLSVVDLLISANQHAQKPQQSV